MNTIAMPDLAYVIDNLEEGILFLDKDRQVVAINRAAMDMLGQTQLEQSEEMIGTLCPSLFPGASCSHECEQSGICSLMQQHKQGKEKTERPDFRRPDGSMVSLSLRALALSPSEPLARCVILLKNRSHEQQLEEEVSERFHLGSLIGHSVSMRNLFQDILKVAASEATVLIEGKVALARNSWLRPCTKTPAAPPVRTSAYTVPPWPKISWSRSCLATPVGPLPVLPPHAPAVLRRRMEAPCSWMRLEKFH